MLWIATNILIGTTHHQRSKLLRPQTRTKLNSPNATFARTISRVSPLHIEDQTRHDCQNVTTLERSHHTVSTLSSSVAESYTAEDHSISAHATQKSKCSVDHSVSVEKMFRCVTRPNAHVSLRCSSTAVDSSRRLDCVSHKKNMAPV
jgi:hypothetical protein